MKSGLVVRAVLVLGLGLVLSAAQFLPEEVAEWPKWEEFMATADIVGEQQLVGPESVTSPYKLTLEQEGVKRFALWKNIYGRVGGFLESWKWEIAAYLLSKHLELNMVPPTVERRFRNNRGSLQLWVEYEMTLKKKEAQKVKTPSYKVFQWNRELFLQRFFDNLIANEDRHQNNYLILADWRMALIDHSRSFRSSKKFTKELLYTEKRREGSMEMREIPRAMVEKIKAFTPESVKAIIGEYLTEEEINAMLLRRDLMLLEIDKLIKKYGGEDQVLY